MNNCAEAKIITSNENAEIECTNAAINFGVRDVQVNGVSVVSEGVANLYETRITESEIDSL